MALKEEIALENRKTVLVFRVGISKTSKTVSWKLYKHSLSTEMHLDTDILFSNYLGNVP